MLEGFHGSHTMMVSSENGNNNSNMTSTQSPPYTISQEERIIQACLMVALAIASLIGNGTVAFMVITQQKLRSLSNILLANLASIDLVKSGILIPLLTTTLATTSEEAPLKGRIACLVVLSFSAFAATVTTLAYVTIAIDRYIAVVHPVTYKQPWKSHHGLRLFFVLSPWAVAAALVFPIYIGSHIDVNIGHQSCTSYRAEFLNNTTTTVVSLTIFVVSLFAMIILYALLFNSLRQLAKRRVQFVSTENTQRVEERVRKMEIHTAKTTAMTVAAYIFLWILYMIATLLRYQNFRSVWLDFLSLFVQYTSGVINPFLYFSRIRQFHEELLRLCHPNRRRYARPGSMKERSRRVSSTANARSLAAPPSSQLVDMKRSSESSEQPTNV